MQVVIPSQLHDYTGGRSRVPAAGDSLATVLDDLDRRFPGLRFRVVDEQGAIRPHIRFYVNRAAATSLAQPIAPDDELLIVGALSGG
ncbi:MAG: MoaD/ThiS family protein [Rhodocyclaceae bacterium]|nr:MoaD/ThiS family protein [Rhodocyclaceae bacterium]